jgi:uncharacterized UPF0146 family protein
MVLEPWKIPKATLTQAINKEPLIDGIPIADLKYTILDNANVVYRDAQELAELHSIEPTITPKEYVAYRPARLSLHETIIAISTTIKIANEAQMQDLTKLIHAEVVQDLDKLYLNADRLNLEHNITSLVDKYLAGEDISTEFDGKLKKICDQIKNAESNGVVFGKFKGNFTARDAMIARATDLMFSNLAKQQIEILVAEKLAAHAELQYLETPAADQRLMLMVTGGPASGKGSSVVRLEENAKNEGISWDNMVKINTDIYKPLLLEPGTVKPELYSTLSQEEAATINQGIQQRLLAMAQEGRAPHIFIDQVYVGPTQIDLGLINGGKVRGIIVSTDTGDAVERSFARGEIDGDKGRYESTSLLLSCHKAMTEQVPTTLSKYLGKNVTFLLVDNNVKRGEQATDVMHIDLKDQNLQIYDQDNLKKFILKTSIITTAQDNESLYDRSKTVSVAAYLNPLVERGINIQHTSLFKEYKESYVSSVAAVDEVSQKKLGPLGGV